MVNSWVLGSSILQNKNPNMPGRIGPIVAQGADVTRRELEEIQENAKVPFNEEETGGTSTGLEEFQIFNLSSFLSYLILILRVTLFFISVI